MQGSLFIFKGSYSYSRKTIHIPGLSFIFKQNNSNSRETIHVQGLSFIFKGFHSYSRKTIHIQVLSFIFKEKFPDPFQKSFNEKFPDFLLKPFNEKFPDETFPSSPFRSKFFLSEQNGSGSWGRRRSTKANCSRRNPSGSGSECSMGPL